MNEQNSDFDWLTADPEQLEWAINYLQTRITITYPQNATDQEKLDTIIQSIVFYKTGDSRKVFRNRMKGAWSSAKRNKKIKKTIAKWSLETSPDIKTKVNNLAKKYNISINQTVEQLLEAACKAQANGEKLYQQQLKILKSHNKSKRAREGRVAELFDGQADLDKEDKPSIEPLQDLLATEMFERHQLEIQLIEMLDSTEPSENLKEEKQRYHESCEKYHVAEVPDNQIDQC